MTTNSSIEKGVKQMKPTVQDLYDREVKQREMFIECGYTQYKDIPPMLPAFAFPGGYPMYYVDGDNSLLCASCATESLTDPDEFENSKPQYWGIYYEGSDMYCANCDAVIESAYGDPESEGTE